MLAGATPAALGLLADISERFPADRGAIMGLYSVFLAIGQIIGSLIGGFAADWRGIDGMLVATRPARDRPRPALAPAAAGARDRRQCDAGEPARQAPPPDRPPELERQGPCAILAPVTRTSARTTRTRARPRPSGPTAIAALLAARDDLAAKLAARRRRSTPTSAGGSGSARRRAARAPPRGRLRAEQHAVYVVCDGTCGKTFLR